MLKPLCDRHFNRIKKVFILLTLISICFLGQNLNSTNNYAYASSFVSTSEQNVNSRFVPIYILLAQSYVTKGDYLSAKYILQKTIEYDKDSLNAHLNLALIYESLKDLNGAETEFKKILSSNPDDMQVNYYLGLIYDAEGKTETALDYLFKAAKIMPSASVYYDIGVVYAKKNLYNESVQYTQKAFDLKPDFAEAANNICYGLANIGKPQEAILNCRKALALNPRSAPTLDSMGFAYYSMNDYENAIQFYKKAIMIDPEIGDIYLHLAQAFQKSGKKEDAIKNYEKFLQMEPNADEAKNIKNIIYELKSDKLNNAANIYKK